MGILTILNYIAMGIGYIILILIIMFFINSFVWYLKDKIEEIKIRKISKNRLENKNETQINQQNSVHVTEFSTNSNGKNDEFAVKADYTKELLIDENGKVRTIN